MDEKGKKLPRRFYERDDVVRISRQLLGKILCTEFNGEFTSGVITETEAYCGRSDKACHANNGLRTARTETMYEQGGTAYVYLCYGIHHLFNVVTNRRGIADAVLIRAVQPLNGSSTILNRRNRDRLKPGVSNGPGKLTMALGIRTDYDGIDLLGNHIWIEDRGINYSDTQISSSPRIGVDYAGEDAKKPWRFFVKDSEWVSGIRP
jgi:DNA-3-methyladenine glycosylase